MSRADVSDEDRLRKVASFRLTENDYFAYRKKFIASGLTQSEFFRRYVLSNTTTVIAKNIASTDRKRAVFLLAKASNNINQLAHRANAARLQGAISGETFIGIISQLQQLNQFLIGAVQNVD